MAMEGDSNCMHGVNLDYLRCSNCEEDRRNKDVSSERIYMWLSGFAAGIGFSGVVFSLIMQHVINTHYIISKTIH